MKNIFYSILGVVFLCFSCQVEKLTDENLENQSDDISITDKKNNNNDSNDCSEAINDLITNLPQTVSASTTAKPGNNSYFDLDILNTNLSGTNIPAWCADQDLSLEVEGPLEFDVYSSYGELPEGVFEKPENFDLVNWVLNQDFIGKVSPSGGTYAFGHIQYAIWLLVDDSVCQICTYLTDPTGDWNNDPSNIIKAQEIADAALANGEGYIPGCGDKFGIILVPDGKQSLIITKEITRKLDGCETAFAIGNTTDGEGDDSTCFIEDSFNRWGWTIGPLNEGQFSYNVYAGAGQCDTSKGALVGTVDVSYFNGDVSVTYNINDAYTLIETHTYAGNNPYPVKGKKETVAPGQFKIEQNLSGEIYVIAHSVVCGD